MGLDPVGSEAGPRHGLDMSVPHSARVWNYWMGGKDNYTADRAAGDAFAGHYPEIFALARQSRRFLIRTVEHLAGAAGVRQFVDIGTGLPVLQNTHDVALGIAPESRIVYVDNDPLVLAHARALQNNPGRAESVAYVDADVRDRTQLIGEISAVLDMREPVAFMFMGVLGHVEQHAEALSIVDALMAAAPSGSYLAAWDSTCSEAFDAAMSGYNHTGSDRYWLRTVEQITGFFHGLELLPPGVVPITEWHRSQIDTDIAVDGYGAVARKP